MSNGPFCGMIPHGEDPPKLIRAIHQFVPDVCSGRGKGVRA